jgi:demethylmenaquinone methyltransferase/2-methoxy-6-polyprenyl-1,4-benzoquinol methylase
LAARRNPGPAGADACRLSPHAPLAAYYGDEPQRRRFLDALFDRTASRYDGIAGLLSLGSGPWHRRRALSRAGLERDMAVLDVAVGTGALAREAAGLLGPPGRVVGIDPSPGMLAQARMRVSIPVVQGLAEHLPFRSESFDFLSMGYALRHVSDLRATFREYHRVLRPGGRLLILEFTHPRTRLRYQLARFYLGTLVPWLAQLRAGSRDARLLMRYCWASVARGLPAETICGAIVESGFVEVRTRADLGVLIEFVAVKPG